MAAVKDSSFEEASLLPATWHPATAFVQSAAVQDSSFDEAELRLATWHPATAFVQSAAVKDSSFESFDKLRMGILRVETGSLAFASLTPALSPRERGTGRRGRP